ncbi:MULTISPECIES: NHLP bacteriocin system secretion protein [Thiorhodovibrio]|uniref:NHLP bacteriocin system secretion protein n=1 Tax=Thiorhodovibrio TaxID=61593 RepID=UPI001913AB30|nr:MULTISPECIES: NHLP bacteriocin system secretion protein [Thiorhodovibrio]MBK5970285.1 NHLP bacteriocin system secretion protein [Thiorhodovibrio winogradskyi]WPL14854.1 NHLM bacteriocin system secretion protein [Thiorhodovibrio litoralis]
MLFRPQALAKVTDPDQLDQLLSVVRPRHVLGFGVVAAVMVAGLIWSILSTAPVIVGGPGVLLSSAGVAAVTAEGSGHIDAILVQPGDAVTLGQPIARIRQPERLDELEAAEDEARDVNDRYELLQTEFAAQDQIQTDLMARLRAADAERVATLEKQRAVLAKRTEGEARLQGKGMVSAVNQFETAQLLAKVEHEIATARNRMVETSLQQEQDAARRHQELAELRIQSLNLRRRAANLRRDYDRDGQVLATATGDLAELGADVNDPVTPGQVIARLLVDGAEEAPLTAVAYLPAGDGKKVKIDMPARVSPSTVKVELDGYIHGRVIRVAELPSSREGLMRRLKNAVFVDEILSSGTPFEVEVELQRDATTPSGYAWTSGQGPDIPIEPGTLARSEVVVERIHLISLLFPAMEYVYGWFRAL